MGVWGGGMEEEGHLFISLSLHNKGQGQEVQNIPQQIVYRFCN